MNCPVCHANNCEKIYQSSSEVSISSLGIKMNGFTNVFMCNKCTHVYTVPLENLDEYYSTNYNILVESEEEDQLYITKEGEKHFRLNYQADVFEKKVELPANAVLLDYGCAKAATLKIIAKRHISIIPMCFDISSAYTKFWESFVTAENRFTHSSLPSVYNESIDCIASFFSLEHANQPVSFMGDISRLLKSNGTFFCIVPNVFSNWADLIVADHVNHFTKNSLKYLMQSCGFEVQEIDEDIYHGAYVVTAKKNNKTALDSFFKFDEPMGIQNSIKEIATYWSRFSSRIQVFKSEIGENDFAIYGSGFYGGYIASLLQKKPSFFLDQNPHRQGQYFFEAEIINPKTLPDKIEKVIVGLNPKNAKKIIENNSELSLKNRKFMYLDSEI